MSLLSFNKSQLFKIWVLLSPKECKDLGKWLEGPWPKYNNNILQLYQALLKYYPEFQFDGLTKEEILKEVFPGKNLSLKNLSTLMSQLSGEIENFMIHQSVMQDSYLREEILIQELDKRGAIERASKKRGRLIEDLSSKKPKAWHDLIRLSTFYEKQHRSSTAYQRRTSHIEESGLLQADYYLDLSYLLAKYRFLLEFVEREKILGVDHQSSQKIDRLSSWDLNQEMPVFEIYKSFLHQRNQSGQEKFDQLKTLFFEKQALLNQLDQSIILFFLINEGTRVQQKEQTKMLQALLELYEIGLEKNLLFYENQITPTTFANIVTTANLMGRFNLAKRVIAEQQLGLPRDIREDAVAWANAHLAFNSKDTRLWEKAKQIQHIGSIKNTFTVRAKVLFIQIWFEDYVKGRESDVNFMLDFCDAFSKQLRRSKLYSKGKLQERRNFIKYTQHLIRLKDRYQLNQTKLLRKKEEIKRDTVIHAKKWLLEHVDQMIGE